jgi:uncharacterized membrane protein YfcA
VRRRECRSRPPSPGFGVGALTGLVGVGGGFVIVPALIVGLSFGVREAMATSMAIVAAVSVFGLVAHLASGSSLDLPVAVAIGGAAVIGAAGGPGARGPRLDADSRSFLRSARRAGRGGSRNRKR